MARPRKISNEVEEKILELMEQGFCLKDIAQAVGISDATIKRHRERNMDFNKRFLEASKRSWDNIEALKKYGWRTYRRKVNISLNYGKKPFVEPLAVLERHSEVQNKPQTWMGLPIHPMPLEWQETGWYLNPNTQRVECMHNEVLHVCSMDTWERKHRPQPEEPLIIAVY